MPQLKSAIARKGHSPREEEGLRYQLYVDIRQFPELGNLVISESQLRRVSKAQVVREALQEHFADRDPKATTFTVRFRPGREAALAEFVREQADQDLRSPSEWIGALIERAAADSGV